MNKDIITLNQPPDKNLGLSFWSDDKFLLDDVKKDVIQFLKKNHITYFIQSETRDYLFIEFWNTGMGYKNQNEIVEIFYNFMAKYPYYNFEIE